ncbi:helix-turn-helix transcriptional regulator [Actinokineospora iranica]|uniref:DNA-binding response regulator, NarL/FixJ family, contains REC and HTH domains n=1 Tax=Actinokineospora iranica TaxID=1271860 RepID=A0A1G6XD91_9PSEU|nr:LuxR C-terminal-related transcriptional regulator [Actinokineospora iranica]SDD75337.1 DNA-binding response regulator, NarL/FixJ family, contains REC and HTH domains [Actinokineospora iranica]
MTRVRVAVSSADPLTLVGLTSQLRSFPELAVEPGAPTAATQVVVVAAARLTAALVSTLRSAAARLGPPVVLVVDEIGEAEVLTAVECRVVAVLPRAAATTERLPRAVLAAAAGGGVLPPNLLGELLKHVERLQREILAPLGHNSAGLTPREIDVLRLMAEGCDTAEIAARLCYSERMIKNVIHAVTNRLNLRNRPHAVAYALRAGVI